MKEQIKNLLVFKQFRAKIDAIRAGLLLQICFFLKTDNFHPISLKEIENSNMQNHSLPLSKVI